jgi:hypothetical protein
MAVPPQMTTGVGLAILLAAILFLIFCSALFSGLETALFSLKPHQLRRLEENHPGLMKFIQLFRENPRRVLNVLLLGDGLVNVPLVILCLFFLWEGPLGAQIPQWLAGIAIFHRGAGLRFNSAPGPFSPPSTLAIGAFTLLVSCRCSDA